jgi:hypothetical protein
MSLQITRANLPGSGAPKVTWNSGTFWTRAGLMLPLKHTLVDQVSSMYGRVTKTRGGRMIEINLPLYGFWTQLSTIFPSYILGFVPGARMFGSSDLPMTIIAKNGDQIVLNNVQLVGISDLKLKANEQIFSGNFKFVALIANTTAPTANNAYYTLTTGATYAEGNFPQSNFKSLAWTGAWGSRTGFTNILTQDGWDISWEIKTTPDVVDGIGPVDMFIDQFWAKAKCIPVGPTLDQLMGVGTDVGGIDFQGTNAAVGADIAADADNLVLTDGTSTLTLTKAALVETGLVFEPSKKRTAATVWESTLGFTTGAPNAMVTVA